MRKWAAASLILFRVTPTSQIVGTQAVMNVVVGKYKTFPKESKGLLRGEYGQVPGEVNEEVRALAGIKPEDVITCRPADQLQPEVEKYREEFKDIAKSDEDVLSLALFPQPCWPASAGKSGWRACRRAPDRAGCWCPRSAPSGPGCPAPKYREEFKDIAKSDEDVLSLALFPQVAPKFRPAP
mgnify:CR=1 FL=1